MNAGMNIFWFLFIVTVIITVYGFYRAIKEGTLVFSWVISSVVLSILIIVMGLEIYPEFKIFYWFVAYCLFITQGTYYLLKSIVPIGSNSQGKESSKIPKHSGGASTSPAKIAVLTREIQNEN